MKIYIILGVIIISLLVGCTPQVPSNIPPDDVIIIENTTYDKIINDSNEYVKEEIADDNITIDGNINTDKNNNDYINEEI